MDLGAFQMPYVNVNGATHLQVVGAPMSVLECP